MSAAPPSGGPPPDAAVQQMLKAQVQLLCIQVPGATEQMAFQALEWSARIEEQLGEVWMELAEGEAPYLAVKLTRRGNDGPPIAIAAKKKLTGRTTGEEYRDIALVTGLLSNVYLRALFYLGGWAIQFSPSQGPSKLVTM